MSDTKTGCRRYAAAPHDPTLGPMHVPSVAAWYACGRFGATPYRRCNPSSSNRKIEHNIPSLWASIRRVILVRTSFRDVPMRIIFSASSTASLGRVCARDGDLEGACRLGNVLTFAINWPPTSDVRNIIQTEHLYHEGKARSSNLAQQWHVVVRDLYCSSAIHLPLPRVSPRSPGRMTAELVRSH